MASSASQFSPETTSTPLDAPNAKPLPPPPVNLTTSPANDEQTRHEQASQEEDELNFGFPPSGGSNAYDLYEWRRNHVPVYVSALYIISLFLSSVGLLTLLVTVGIALNVESMRPWAMQKITFRYIGQGQEVAIIYAINIVWCAFNLRLVKLKLYLNLTFLNCLYDLLLWAALLAFTITAYLFNLLDRDWTCSGARDDQRVECDWYEELCIRLILVGTGLGYLIAVLHFIFLVGRCCLDVPITYRHNGEVFMQLHERNERQTRAPQAERQSLMSQGSEDGDLESGRAGASNKPSAESESIPAVGAIRL